MKYLVPVIDSINVEEDEDYGLGAFDLIVEADSWAEAERLAVLHKSAQAGYSSEDGETGGYYATHAYTAQDLRELLKQMEEGGRSRFRTGH